MYCSTINEIIVLLSTNENSVILSDKRGSTHLLQHIPFRARSSLKYQDRRSLHLHHKLGRPHLRRYSCLLAHKSRLRCESKELHKWRGKNNFWKHSPGDKHSLRRFEVYKHINRHIPQFGGTNLFVLQIQNGGFV